MAPAGPPVPTAGTYLGMTELQGGDPWALAKDAAKEYAKEFRLRLDTMWKASGAEMAEPLQRLHAYLLWTLEDWQRKFLKYPPDTNWYWNDFGRLRKRALNGEYGQEIGAVCYEHWSEQMMLAGTSPVPDMPMMHTTPAQMGGPMAVPMAPAIEGEISDESAML